MSTPPPPSPSPSPHTLTLFTILSESKRIINAHSRHFLALSVLFLLPLSFSLIIFPLSLSKPLIVSTQFLLLDPTHPQQPFTLPILIYSLFIYTLSLCATATITYSTVHGFYGRPVKFIPSIKSLISSFLPFVLTTLAALLILSLISLTIFLFFTVIIRMSENLGFVIVFDYTSCYFVLTCAVVGVTLGVFFMYLLVNWSLACVVVVTESKYGFEPLWRSAYLVKGMKSVSVWLLVLFGVLVGVWVWVNVNVNVNDVLRFDAVGGWRSWGFVVQVVTGTSVLSLVFLISVSANAVLFMYCKALRGELAVEIAEEFAREYVSLPFDEEKVPHVVTVV